MILQGCNEKNEENNQYLNKIWVLDLGEGYSTDISLYITEIDSENISGKISFDGSLAELPYYSDSTRTWPKPQGDFEGTFVNGAAKCTFSNSEGDQGELLLTFKEDEVILANIEFEQKSESMRKWHDRSNGEYRFRAYNVKDLINSAFLNYQIKEKICCGDDWGFGKDVYLVIGKVTDIETGRYYPDTMIIDREGNILYRIHPGYLSGSEVADVTIEDINQDGLQDISVTTRFTIEEEGKDYYIKWDSYQMKMGGFYLNERIESVQEF